MLTIAKAILGGVIAGLSSIEAAFAVGSPHTKDYISAVIAALVGFGVVFGVPNKSSQ